MTVELSPLAHQVPGVRDPKLGIVRAPWGLLLHTTGGGVVSKAHAHGTTPLAEAIRYYIESQNDPSGKQGYKWGGPGYVIDYDGSIHQVAPDNVETAHAGGPYRAEYLSGDWEAHIARMHGSTEAAAQWRRRWPTFRNPYSLFPSHSPNIDYVGCEMVPIGDGFGGAPMAPGLRFTRAQHEAAIALGRDIALRHGWPLGWAASSRLVGHEDVDPLERADKHGGWDPGYNRDVPYFDLGYVRTALAPQMRP